MTMRFDFAGHVEPRTLAAETTGEAHIWRRSIRLKPGF
jgi:hypothetical protein